MPWIGATTRGARTVHVATQLLLLLLSFLVQLRSHLAWGSERPRMPDHPVADVLPMGAEAESLPATLPALHPAVAAFFGGAGQGNLFPEYPGARATRAPAILRRCHSTCNLFAGPAADGVAASVATAGAAALAHAAAGTADSSLQHAAPYSFDSHITLSMPADVAAAAVTHAVLGAAEGAKPVGCVNTMPR